MVESIDVRVGRRLRNRRKLLGLTQIQMAAVCGVSFQQIQKYESGKTRLSAVPHLWQLSQLCLEVSVTYFFEELSRSKSPAALRSGEKGLPLQFRLDGRFPARRAAVRNPGLPKPVVQSLGAQRDRPFERPIASEDPGMKTLLITAAAALALGATAAAADDAGNTATYQAKAEAKIAKKTAHDARKAEARAHHSANKAIDKSAAAQKDALGGAPKSNNP